MKRFGGVPATKSETSGLSPAVSCGTEAAVMVFPLASKAWTMVLSAAISLSFDQVWKSVSSAAFATKGKAPKASASAIPFSL